MANVEPEDLVFRWESRKMAESRQKVRAFQESGCWTGQELISACD